MKDNTTLAKRSETHFMRRVWHIITGILGLSLYFVLELSRWECVLITAIIALLGFIFDFRRLKSAKLNNSMYKYLGSIMRESERDSFSGLPFYALGVCFSFLFFSESIAIMAIMFLVFADPMASVIGVNFGRDRLFPNKSLQGTIAAFLTCFFIVVFYAVYLGRPSPNLIIFAFFSALFGCFSELISTFNIDDNLSIPVLSGGGMSLLNLWLNVF